MSVASALGANAESLTIEWRGRQIKIGYLEWGPIITALENWLIEKALNNKAMAWDLAVKKGFMTADQASANMVDFVEKASNGGEYAFGSKNMMQIFALAESGNIQNKNLSSFAGILKLISLLLNVSEDEVVMIMAEKAQELSVKLAIALKRSLPDPKDQGPTQPANQ